MIGLVDAGGTLGRQSGGVPDHNAPNLDHVCLQVQPWDADAIRNHLRLHDVEVGEIVTQYGALGYGPSPYADQWTQYLLMLVVALTK